MTDTASPPPPIHYSTRIAPAEPGDYEWRADRELGERHAFPPVHGFRRSIGDCQVRFTAAFGKHGATTCTACLTALREQLRATIVALHAVGVRTDR